MRKGFSVLLLCFVLVCALLVGCTMPDWVTPKYERGQYVASRIDGHRGMIVWINRSTRVGYTSYAVRFAAKVEHTNTHLLSVDGDIERKPYALVRMYEHELEPWTEPHKYERE